MSASPAGRSASMRQAAKSLSGGKELDDVTVTTDIYGTSHCEDPAKGCDPGYDNRGIKPQLTLQLEIFEGSESIDSETFTIPYNAIAWTEVMGKNLDGLFAGLGTD